MLYCPTCGRHYESDVKTCPEDGALLQADATVAVQIPSDPMIGRTFDDKYRLDELLGTGGMGTVYRATHLLIERPVAVKILNPRLVEDEAAQERFRREARAAGRLQHGNAVAVTDFGQTSDGYVYIVMELLEGRTLRDVLAREGPLETARAVSLMLQVSAAVEAAHDAFIIHRDLKPGNIFIVQSKTAPPFVKVLDFGIAKLATDATDEADPVTLTQAGVMIGTPRYMSPEQCNGLELTPASDVYSLGIILYEMLTGTTPFTGTTPLAIALKHSSEPPRPPRELVASIPVALEEVVLHALEKDPGDRPPDAGAFRRELYATAERLGLEHAAGFSAPTLESLHNAGTQTPSGRLVIDLERVREQRAAAYTPTETVIGKGESGEGYSLTDGSRGAPVTSHPPVQSHAFSRAGVPLDWKQEWLKRLRHPLALTGISLTALLLVIIFFAFVATRSSSKPSPVTNSNAGVVTTPASNITGPSPQTEAAGESDDDAQRREAARNSKRSSGKANANRRQKPSKLRRFVNKVKGILKD
ncbi:MAG TPA: serine/threonine-protein kinase [Pyrinomonadaceae bacterium]|nr:serine/threonine-protein kinase [Pyrinomonadaceae bacterium]